MGKIKFILLLVITSFIMTSCMEDELITCNEEVTGYYLETYYQGYSYGYSQYTVFTIDDYGYTYTYTDATNVPYLGKCW